MTVLLTVMMTWWCVLVGWQLAIPGMLMLGEWWAAESIILLGGLLEGGAVNVSTLSIYQTVNAVAYMVSYGVHVAANVRVGNNIGRCVRTLLAHPLATS